MSVACTGISKDVVDQAMTSAITGMKDSRYRWSRCSDTGAISIFSMFKQIICENTFPKNFYKLKRVCAYLSEYGTGCMGGMVYFSTMVFFRHRVTAGYYVSKLLVIMVYSTHTFNTTGFNVTEASTFVEQEGSDALSLLSKYKVDFLKLKKSLSSDLFFLHMHMTYSFMNVDTVPIYMLTTIHQLTSTHYLMRSFLPRTLGKDEATYVEYGFARFVDAEKK